MKNILSTSLLACALTLAACGDSGAPGIGGGAPPVMPPPPTSKLACPPITLPVVHGALGGELNEPAPAYDWQAGWQSCEVTFRSRLHGSTLYAVLFAPERFDPARDQLPVVVIGPGSATGVQSQYQWAARELAANGYIAITVDPQGVGNSELVDYPQTSDNYIDAAVSTLDFIESDANPLRQNTDISRIGVAGHSLSAFALSWLQGEDTRIKAIVAWDNLATTDTGDKGTTAGGPASEGIGQVTGGRPPLVTPLRPVRPRVPAMGQANDSSQETDPEVKKIAYNAWREAGVPSMEISFLGKGHIDWAQGRTADASSDSAKSRELQLFQYYNRAWFDLWLKNDASAIQRLTATSVLGLPLAEIMEPAFHSALYLPAAGIDCPDILTGSCAAFQP